jgi:hypothetical protein
MSSKEHFDFWYAVNNTEVLRLPARRLETFGTTVVNYHLVTELMDVANKVRVREGRVRAYRPEIVTPRLFAESLLEGFGEEAAHYADWLREHEKDLYILKYGFMIGKEEINDHIISESVQAVVDRVRTELESKDDPLSALVLGVDEPWEVCILKLMVDIARQSAPQNVADLRGDPQGSRHEIESEFRAAAKDPSRVQQLYDKLKESGLFDEYEDRFFALVRSRK